MTDPVWHYVLTVDGRDIDLSDGEVTLGRSRTSTVRVEHESVSRSHALVTFERGQAIVKDLNSSNGTYVAGRRVLNETRLGDGDRIQLGAAVIAYRLVPPAGLSERTALMDAPPVPAAVKEPPDAPGAEPMEISAEELFRDADRKSEAPPEVPAPAGGAAAALEAVKSMPPAPPPAPHVEVAPVPPPLPPAPAPEPPRAPVEARPPSPSAPARPAMRPLRPDSTLSEVPLHLGGLEVGPYDPPGAARVSSPRPGPGPAAVPRNAAGFFPRLVAALVDQVILLAINLLLLSPVFLILFFRGEFQSKEAGPDLALYGVALLCLLLILAADLWYVVGGWAKSGRTPGKSLLGLAVVSSGTPPGAGLGWRIALRRALFTWLCSIPFGAGFLMILFRKDRRAWHDLLSGTWVVKIR